MPYIRTETVTLDLSTSNGGTAGSAVAFTSHAFNGYLVSMLVNHTSAFPTTGRLRVSAADSTTYLLMTIPKMSSAAVTYFPRKTACTTTGLVLTSSGILRERMPLVGQRLKCVVASSSNRKKPVTVMFMVDGGAIGA